MLKQKEVIAKAIAAGAKIEEIEEEAAKWIREVGSVPYRNMIVALNMSPWLNGRAEWVRLAGAMMAKSLKRKFAA